MIPNTNTSIVSSSNSWNDKRYIQIYYVAYYKIHPIKVAIAV